jgi:hypothetical protein
MLNLSNFGKKLKFKERTTPAEPLTEKDLFIETMNLFSACWNRTNKMYDIFKINILEYEEDYFQIIENLMYMKYGDWKTEIILWYIFGRVDEEGNIYPLVKKTNGEDQQVILRTPVELWEFIEQLENEKK